MPNELNIKIASKKSLNGKVIKKKKELKKKLQIK